MAFTTFYIETERLITIASQRDEEVVNLYNSIIDTIDGSLLSDSKGLKTELTDAYLSGIDSSQLNNFYYNEKAVAFVGELQKIATEEYGSVDEFYNLSGITVSQIFADLSESAGYPISPQYIEDIS